MTNWALHMLSACARGLVQARRAKTIFSFRAYMVDLVILLQESMTGEAATACFTCISQAPKNLQSSKNALDFGKTFAKLYNKPKQVAPEKLADMIKYLE